MSTASRSRRWPRPPRWACSMSSTASPASRSGRSRRSKVEKGDVPGEWYAPTQPIPTKPRALRAHRRHAGRPDRLHARAACRRRWNWSRNTSWVPIFTPPVVEPTPGPPRHPQLGPANGGTNWPGGSFNPENHTVYVYACNSCMSPIGLVPPPPGMTDLRYVEGMAGQTGRDGQCRGRRCRRGCRARGQAAGAPPPAADGGDGSAPDRAGPAADQAALRAPSAPSIWISGDIVWQVAAWRDARLHPQQSGAEGHQHPAHRPDRLQHRHPGDQDAGDRRRRPGHHHAGSSARRACCAPMTRRPARKWAMC